MKLTKEEQEKRWPNIAALTAGMMFEQTEYTEAQLQQIDELDPKTSDPGFMKFMTNIIGPVMLKIAKAKK